MRLSVKACLRLLCGISVLFSVDGEIPSITETSSKAATAAPNTANTLLTSAHNESETQAATWDRSATHNPAEVTATAHTSVSHTTERAEAVASSSNSSTAGLVVVTTAAAARSSGPPMLNTPTAVTAARPTGDAQPPPNTTISETVKPTEAEIQRRSSTTSTDMTSPETTSATSLRVWSTAKPEVTSGLSPSTTSQTTHTISSASSSTVTVTNPASEVSDPTSSPATTTKTLTTSSASSSTVTVTNPASEVSDPTSSPAATTKTLTISSASSSTVTVTNPASEGSDPTSSPATTTKTLTTSSSEISASSHSPTESPTDGSSISTSVVSTSPAGIFPKRLPIASTTPTPANTAAPCKVSKVPPSTSEVQPCSTRGEMSHCLIAIASLAVLACIFMVCTVILCTKLSSRRYKVRKPKESTEMMCISRLLPEEDFTYTRHRTNGVLVFPSGRDSDEEGGDNITLSSFLPENDRYV